MHDIRFIRENPEAFDRGLARRGLEPQAGRLIALDEKRRIAIQAAESGASTAERGFEGNRRGEEGRKTRRERRGFWLKSRR